MNIVKLIKYTIGLPFLLHKTIVILVSRLYTISTEPTDNSEYKLKYTIIDLQNIWS